MPLPFEIPASEILWARAGLGDLLPAVAQRSGLQTERAEIPAPSARVSLDAWIETGCAHLGVESEKSAIRIQDARERLEAAAPAVLETAAGFVGIVRSGHGKLSVIARDFSVRPVSLAALIGGMRHRVEAADRHDIETMLASCGLELNSEAVSALLDEKLRAIEIGTLWQLRTRPGAGVWRQLREARVTARLALLLAAHTIEYVLWIAAWWVIGMGALEGRIDRGWLSAWILLLLTIVPFRILSTWSGGVLAVGCGGLLRQRLLAGTLQLDPAEIRGQGAGQLLGRTFESEAVESLALSGGIGALLALTETCVVLALLAAGAGGWISAAVFAAWLVLGAWLTLRSHFRRQEWTRRRLALTHDLVEKMTGYRTRSAQQSCDDWHTGEDQALDEYLAASRKMDADVARLTSLLPRTWLLAGIFPLAPAFLHSASAAAMAISISAILLGFRAMERLVGGAAQLSGAWIAATQVTELFRAAERREAPPAFAAPLDGEAILEAREISFAHPGRAAVFQKTNCSVREGDWILLEGASGGGKSTIASVLAGMREPTSGLLLASGFDRRTLGSRAWRGVVATVPQYHENHVFSGTMAFNLLLGREWPPAYQDLQDATEICKELGLDTLLARMPGGMNQMIGETGWQLSQGERSRLFLGRALLQNSRILILDETFAALDPENLRQALECALRRSKAIMVVAHP